MNIDPLNSSNQRFDDVITASQKPKNQVRINYFAQTIKALGDAKFQEWEKNHSRTFIKYIQDLVTYLISFFNSPSTNLKNAKIKLAKEETKLKSFQDQNEKTLSKVKNYIAKYRSRRDQDSKVFIEACKNNSTLRIEERLEASVQKALRAVDQAESICRGPSSEKKLVKAEEELCDFEEAYGKNITELQIQLAVAEKKKEYNRLALLSSDKMSKKERSELFMKYGAALTEIETLKKSDLYKTHHQLEESFKSAKEAISKKPVDLEKLFFQRWSDRKISQMEVRKNAGSPFPFEELGFPTTSKSPTILMTKKVSTLPHKLNYLKQRLEEELEAGRFYETTHCAPELFQDLSEEEKNSRLKKLEELQEVVKKTRIEISELEKK